MNTVAQATPKFPRNRIEHLVRMLESTCGLHFPPEKEEMLLARVRERMTAAGAETLDEYLFLLFERGEQEYSQLLSLLTVNETFFFRHKSQFDHMTSLLSDSFRSERRNSITIWSAGCATGAEPYSIAIALQGLAGQHGATLRIVASDVDPKAIEAARGRRFTDRSVTSEMPADLRQRHFARDGEAHWMLEESIASLVKFRVHNLLTDIYPADLDVIFCRNVLYYFRDTVRREILQRLHASLRRGGLLFLSPVESLWDWEPYFEEVAGPGGMKCFRKWDTDRRVQENGPGSEQRRPVETRPFPVVDLNGETIVIRGIVDGSSRCRMVHDEFAYNLRHLLRSGITSFALDLRDLAYISNEGLASLIRVLKDVALNKLRPQRVIVKNAVLRDHLMAAGIALYLASPDAVVIETGAARANAPNNTVTAAPTPLAPVKFPMTAAAIPPALSLSRPAQPRTEPRPVAARSDDRSCQTAIAVGDIDDESQALVWVDRLYDMLRSAHGSDSDTTAPFRIDLNRATYIDPSFFVLLRRFVTHWDHRRRLEICCPEFIALHLNKFNIPDAFIVTNGQKLS